MRKRAPWLLPVLILFLGYGGAEAQANNWIEYSVTGDFTAEGRDVDIVLCSTGDEASLLVAARGGWYADFEIQSFEAGEHGGSFQVTVPMDFEGAPSNPVARRMKGDGTATVSEAGTEWGMPVIEVEFSAAELQNDAGQTVAVSGSFKCAVM